MMEQVIIIVLIATGLVVFGRSVCRDFASAKKNGCCSGCAGCSRRDHIKKHGDQCHV
jgi:hypothetical protein